MIIDDFIRSFDDLKKASLSREFNDKVNPVDDVIYPLICKDIPDNVEQEILDRLSANLGRPVENPIIFMRRSPKGIICPHQVHSDASMGVFSLMLYLNDYAGGTSLVRHKKTGIAYNPEAEDFVALVQFDQNKVDEWEITEMIDMKPNRAFIFDSNRLHRAEPIGGCGEGTEARTVLTCFFS